MKFTLMRDRREPVDVTVRACESELQTCEPVEYASEASRVSTIKLTLMRDRREQVDVTVRACEPVLRIKQSRRRREQSVEAEQSRRRSEQYRSKANT